MTIFCKLLSDRGRVNFWKLCQEFGVDPQEKEETGIHVEARVEGLEEISKLMKESPNYSVDVQEREG